MISSSPYFTLDDWLEAMGAGNQQPVIYQQESDIIQQKISLSSSEGGRKVIIIWLPERMNAATANKMLKILEEPPAGTVFLLVSEEPEMILQTVLSRTQRVNIPPLHTEEIKNALQSIANKYDASKAQIKADTNLVNSRKGIDIDSKEFDELDKIVKDAFKFLSTDCICPPNFPVCVCGHKRQANLVNKKPILASEKEQAENSRSHSAKLRILEKI